jgi:hypothetical protein
MEQRPELLGKANWAREIHIVPDNLLVHKTQAPLPDFPVSPVITLCDAQCEDWQGGRETAQRHARAKCVAFLTDSVP